MSPFNGNKRFFVLVDQDDGSSGGTRTDEGTNEQKGKNKKNIFN